MNKSTFLILQMKCPETARKSRLALKMPAKNHSQLCDNGRVPAKKRELIDDHVFAFVTAPVHMSLSTCGESSFVIKSALLFMILWARICIANQLLELVWLVC